MTAETVQAGHQYPSVTRVLKPGTEEYDWYNLGGTYPWPGPAPAPVFSAQPQAVTETSPTSAVFTAAASNTVSWQWQAEVTPGNLDWADVATVFPGRVSGDTTAEFTLSNTEDADDRAVKVVATGPGGSTDSDSAPLVINPAINLSWTAPTERADGSTLVDIDYYTIDYGGVDTVTNPGVLASSIVYAPTTEFGMSTPEPLKTYRARISATDDNGKTSQLSGFVYLQGAA
jgi:hypothetical protein